ncbi:MAG TPA: hypothetical protein VK659_29980, partial [Asanoa sp.]|nr:hypothetical protein [Asanoa sp.]
MTDPDVAELTLTIAHYEALIAASPADERIPEWWYELAAAYHERADHSGDLSDWDRAVTLHRQWRDTFPACEERDVGSATLAEALWQRFLTAFHRHGMPEPEGIVQARTTAAAIGDLVPEVEPGAMATIIGMLHGLALVRVASLTGEPADLDDGIAVLAPA